MQAVPVKPATALEFLVPVAQEWRRHSPREHVPVPRAWPVGCATLVPSCSDWGVRASGATAHPDSLAGIRTASDHLHATLRDKPFSGPNTPGCHFARSGSIRG